MVTNPTNRLSADPRRHPRRASECAAALAAALLAGCGHGAAPPPAAPPPPPVLTGPGIHITVAIPPGWHQVTNTARPDVPEMVAPTTCAGDQELSCAKAMARIPCRSGPAIYGANCRAT
jgi:hypothetical protein